MRGLVLAACLGALCAATSAPALAQSGAVRVDARAEVSAAVYYNSSVVAAIEREHSAEVQDLTRRIEGLERRVAAGETALRAELADLQERLVRELEARDANLARVTAAFRAEVESIAATPQGLEALRLYNANDWTGANAIFNDIIAAADRAEALASGIRRAAPRRQRAALALQAQERGLASTRDVIGHYEEVTRLDPQFYSDWYALSVLYVRVGRLSDARRAAQRALVLAHNAYEQAYALQAEGRVLVQEGNLNEALARVEDALSRVRAAVAASPTDPNLLRLLESQLESLGYVRSLRSGELESALAAHAEALAIAQRLWDTYPENTILLRDLAYRLTSVGNVQTKLGNLREAVISLEMSSATWRELVAIDPQNQWDQEALALTLSRIGDVYALQDNFRSALVAFRESLQLVEAIVARDPNSQNRQLQAAALMKVAELQIALGELTEARRSVEQSLDTIRSLISQTPTSVTLRRDEAWSTFSLGEVERLSGNTEIAIAHFEMAATLFTGLLVASPQNVDLQFAQLGAQFRLAQVRNNEDGISAAIDRFVTLNGLQTQPYSERWVLDLRALAQTRGAR